RERERGPRAHGASGGAARPPRSPRGGAGEARGRRVGGGAGAGPARAEDRGRRAPATGAEAGAAARLSLPMVTPDPSPRRVYDVRPRPPAWGWQVAAYTWTKSVAAGAFLAVLAARLLDGPAGAARLAVGMGVVALVFLALTAGLLVADLKKPRRFLSVLLRPQWRSWLVRGAYLLTGYGLLVTVWLLAHLTGASGIAEVLMWPGAVLAA